MKQKWRWKLGKIVVFCFAGQCIYTQCWEDGAYFKVYSHGSFGKGKHIVDYFQKVQLMLNNTFNLLYRLKEALKEKWQVAGSCRKLLAFLQNYAGTGKTIVFFLKNLSEEITHFIH